MRPNEFKLRKVGIESSSLLIRLWRETFIQAYKDAHSSENLQRYCSKNYTDEVGKSVLLDKNTISMIAYEENNPAGFYILKHHCCPIELDGASSELKQIYVLSKYYGTVLGQELLDSAIEESKNAGSVWLWLCVPDLNHRAQAFYNKLGFDAVGEGPILEVGTDQLPSTIMVCKINYDRY